MFLTEVYYQWIGRGLPVGLGGKKRVAASEWRKFSRKVRGSRLTMGVNALNRAHGECGQKSNA